MGRQTADRPTTLAAAGTHPGPSAGVLCSPQGSSHTRPPSPEKPNKQAEPPVVSHAISPGLLESL